MKNKDVVSCLIYLVKVTAGIILVTYVLRKNEIKIVELYSWKTLIPIAVLVFLQIVIHVLSSYRWVTIFRRMSGQALSIRKGVVISWIGQFYSSFLPEIISTDVSKFYYLNLICPGIKSNVHSIVKDRVVSLISLALLTLCCILSYIYDSTFMLYLLFAFFVFVFLLLITSKITEKFKIPRMAFIISYVTFNLKAVSLVYIVLFLNLSEDFSSVFYLSMLGQPFEVISLTPLNVGVGHFVHDIIFKLKPGIVGAIVYNYYFTAKFLFKLVGGVLLILYRGEKM